MAETELTRQDNGQTIKLAVGARFSVRLDEAPTTGYTWAPLQPSAALALGGSDFSPPAPPSVGGQGQRRLHFDVCRPGTHLLELALVRPWEGADAAVDRFTVTVCASAA